ncbi:MAG TPA: zf-HC2 domain-containing protein, partial [Planctomycetota bacterium]|nr:zf-HC2 domain-containing protein [Planctomycetota bacterium]
MTLNEPADIVPGAPGSGHLKYLLTAYVFDSISDAGKREVEGHLASCAECRAELAELRGTAAALLDALGPGASGAGAPAPEAYSFEARRLERVFQAARERNAGRWIRRWRIPLGLAAAGLVVLITMLSMVNQGGRSMPGVGIQNSSPAAPRLEVVNEAAVPAGAEIASAAIWLQSAPPAVREHFDQPAPSAAEHPSGPEETRVFAAGGRRLAEDRSGPPQNPGSLTGKLPAAPAPLGNERQAQTRDPARQAGAKSESQVEIDTASDDPFVVSGGYSGRTGANQQRIEDPKKAPLPARKPADSDAGASLTERYRFAVPGKEAPPAVVDGTANSWARMNGRQPRDGLQISGIVRSELGLFGRVGDHVKEAKGLKALGEAVDEKRALPFDSFGLEVTEAEGVERSGAVPAEMDGERDASGLAKDFSPDLEPVRMPRPTQELAETRLSEESKQLFDLQSRSLVRENETRYRAEQVAQKMKKESAATPETLPSLEILLKQGDGATMAVAGEDGNLKSVDDRVVLAGGGTEYGDPQSVDSLVKMRNLQDRDASSIARIKRAPGQPEILSRTDQVQGLVTAFEWDATA